MASHSSWSRSTHLLSSPAGTVWSTAVKPALLQAVQHPLCVEGTYRAVGNHKEGLGPGQHRLAPLAYLIQKATLNFNVVGPPRQVYRQDFTHCPSTFSLQIRPSARRVQSRVAVALLQSFPVLLKTADHLVQLLEQEGPVLQKQVGPHVLVEPGHPGQIHVAARRVALVHLGSGAFDIGVGDDVAHLGGIGDHLVVVLRGGHRQVGKAGGGEELFHPVQQ